MAEYIERERIRKALVSACLMNQNCPMFIAAKIDKMIDCEPAANVAPVVHGRWMTWEEQFPGFKPHINDKLGVFCSLCHAHSDDISPYCPNCGAKMDIGEEE